MGKPEMEPVEIFVTRPDPTGNLSVKPAGDRRVDRQKLQHLDQILPRRTGKTEVYTTVRLEDSIVLIKWQFSLHYYISIK